MFSFGDICHGEFCLLSNIMGLNDALLVVLSSPKNDIVHQLTLTACHLVLDRKSTLGWLAGNMVDDNTVVRQ